MRGDVAVSVLVFDMILVDFTVVTVEIVDCFVE